MKTTSEAMRRVALRAIGVSTMNAPIREDDESREQAEAAILAYAEREAAK